MRGSVGDGLRRRREVCETSPTGKGSLPILGARTLLWLACLVVLGLPTTRVLAQAPPSSPVGGSETPQEPPPPRAVDKTGTSQDSSIEQIQPESGQFVFKKKVEEVVLRGIVVDQENNLISNLNRDAFTIFEDGK